MDGIASTRGLSRLTPYERDIAGQPTALEAVIASAPQVMRAVRSLDLRRRSRVVLTGMGSSHFATYSLYKGLLSAGVSAWWVETSQLLEYAHDLLVDGTVLWITSQSGESAEATEILNELGHGVELVVSTNNEASVLARASAVHLPILAGTESTVSTKTYVNSVAIAALAASELLGTQSQTVERLRLTRDAVDTFLQSLTESVAAAQKALGRLEGPLIVTGRGLAAVSARAAGLFLKEAARVPAEGYESAAFRHGAMELASRKLTVVFVDHCIEPDHSRDALLAEVLSAHGVRVSWVSGSSEIDYPRLPSPDREGTNLQITDALAIQCMSLAFAADLGIIAGDFRVAKKVTATL